MSRLPVVSGRECVRALENSGFAVVRREGSHIILRRPMPFAQVVVPDHRTLDRGTPRAILRQCDVSVSEFLHALAG